MSVTNFTPTHHHCGGQTQPRASRSPPRPCRRVELTLHQVVAGMRSLSPARSHTVPERRAEHRSPSGGGTLRTITQEVHFVPDDDGDIRVEGEGSLTAARVPAAQE